MRHSSNPGTSIDSINQILEPGVYYVRVYPGVSGAKTNYSLELKTVKLTGDVENKGLWKDGQGENRNEPDLFYTNGVNLYRYSTSGRTDQGIESDKNTIVVIHGRGASSEDSNIKALAMAAANVYEGKGYQVLSLDWQKPATDALIPPYTAARSITPVAEWAVSTLKKLGIAPQQITLFGHSLGSYVGEEIGRGFGKVRSLIALDPASPGAMYDLDGNRADNQLAKDFRDVADNSLALVASNEYGIFGSVAGDNHRAATAKESFVVRFNGYSRNDDKNGVYHNGVVDVFKDLMSSREEN